MGIKTWETKKMTFKEREHQFNWKRRKEACAKQQTIFLWVKTPCKISEPYDNPLKDKFI
jgi:hypothetical protein